MNVYYARQAILNRFGVVKGYELFYREDENNAFPKIDDHTATSKLLGQTYLGNGANGLTSGVPILVNFGQKSLLEKLPMIASNKEIVVEILETCTPSDELYEAVLALKKLKYRIALDDFVYNKQWLRFLKLANIVKFDIMQTPLKSISKIVKYLLENSKIKLLAEKVETHEEYLEAKKMGFHFFQGFFFQKPELSKKRHPESNELLLLKIYKETTSTNMNLGAIAGSFAQDSGLTAKLLCYINAGGFPIKNKISSVKQALLYLGEYEIKRIIAILVTSALSTNKPVELTTIALVRAMFCEKIVKLKNPSLIDDAYLIGMFSILDAVFDCPMDDILSRMPVTDAISETLLDHEDKSQSVLSIALRCARLFEHGSWHNSTAEALKLGLDFDKVEAIYKEAIVWADSFKN